MKKLFVIVPVLLIIMFLFFIDGHRFSAKSAADSNVFLEKDAELLEEYEVGKDSVFIYKSDMEKQYRTVLTEKRGIFYKSSIATYYPYNSDELQLLGGLSFTTDDNAGTVFSVFSNTEEVAYIELSVDEKFQRKEINKGERVTFIFPFSEQIDFLNPTAFDEDGKALYYFGYPKGGNIIKHEDFRWHKIETENSGG